MLVAKGRPLSSNETWVLVEQLRKVPHSFAASDSKFPPKNKEINNFKHGFTKHLRSDTDRINQKTNIARSVTHRAFYDSGSGNPNCERLTDISN